MGPKSKKNKLLASNAAKARQAKEPIPCQGCYHANALFLIPVDRAAVDAGTKIAILGVAGLVVIAMPDPERPWAFHHKDCDGCLCDGLDNPNMSRLGNASNCCRRVFQKAQAGGRQGKTLRHGLPPFHQRITSSPGSVPQENEHARCARVVQDFPSLSQPLDTVSNAKNDAWAKVVRGKDYLSYSSEDDIVYYVRIYVENILEAMGLDLTISAEIAVKQIRPDLCVLLRGHQLVGVVEVKKPGPREHVDSILIQPTVLGEMFDQMLLVEGFYGMGPVCGILTTGEEWLVAWFEADQEALQETTISTLNSLCTPEKTSASKSSASEETSPTGTTPSQKSPQPHTIVNNDEEGDGDADDTTELPDLLSRCLITTRVFQQQNESEEILQLLCSAFAFMATAHLHHRPGVSRCLFKFHRQKPTVTWHPASYDDVYRRVNFNKFPRSNTSALIALEDLGRGSTGKAWLCVTVTNPHSAACVLKFNNREGLSKLDNEFNNWKIIYPEFEKMVRLEAWSGSNALMMPHCVPIATGERAGFRDAIHALLVANFKNRGLVHPDVRWRNIGQYRNQETMELVPVIFDLHDVRACVDETDINWVDNAVNKLYAKGS